MRLFPTRSALDLAVAGAAVVLAGILLFQPAIVAWGGALVIGLAVARAITLLNVARVRAAGFEMVWRGSARNVRVAKGHTVTVMAEVRNRDTRAVRYAQLRVIGSPFVAVEIDRDSGEVPAGGRLEVAVRLRAKRVGHHGLFGLALEVRGSPGLFEVPLTFSNPFGVEVLPAAVSTVRHRLPLAGAVRFGARAVRRAGEGTEFSEIREHQIGDPLKRVAWKASARRGKLLVRKYEFEERAVVWFVLDASVELWAGRVGAAPLDLAIDGVAELAHEHVRAGHDVALLTLASSRVSRVAPGRGAAHERALLEALAATPAMYEPERSGLDERGVAFRVLEHLRALAPAQSRDIRSSDLDAIAALCEEVRSQAPFPDLEVTAPSRREAALRTHLAAFGIAGPPRLEAQRASADALLADTLRELMRARSRDNLVYVVSPLPDEERTKQLAPVLREAQRRHLRLRWLHPAELPGVELPPDALGRVARTAARWRSESERHNGELRLRRLGIRTSVCMPSEAAFAPDAFAPDAVRASAARQASA